MERVNNLITTLKLCMPELETAPLYASVPSDINQITVLKWLYENLAAQKLMVYEEWNEYSGYIPELKLLSNISFSEEPANYIFTLLEGIDWETADTDPYLLPYIIPWLEHINFYLQPHGVRLVDLLPFENAYILCLRDDEVLLDKLHSALEILDMGINDRQAMDQKQVSIAFESIVSGEEYQ